MHEHGYGRNSESSATGRRWRRVLVGVWAAALVIGFVVVLVVTATVFTPALVEQEEVGLAAAPQAAPSALRQTPGVPPEQGPVPTGVLAKAGGPAQQMQVELDTPRPAGRPAPSVAPALTAAPQALPPATEESSWMSAAADAMANVAASVLGTPDPAQGLEPVDGLQVALVDGATDGGTQRAAADVPAMQLLDELDAPLPEALPAPSAAPAAPVAPPVLPPAIEESSWMSTAADVVAGVAASVLGTPDPSQGLEIDDGLQVALVDGATDGWTEQAAADDPALQMLAELDAPLPAGRPAPQVLPPATEESSWMSAAADVVAGVAASVLGTPDPSQGLEFDDGLQVALVDGATDGWTEQAAADDPALQMLAELDAPLPAGRPAPQVLPPATELQLDDGLDRALVEGVSDGWTAQAAADDPALQMLEELGARPSTVVLPPAQEEPSWLSSAADAVTSVATAVLGPSTPPADAVALPRAQISRPGARAPAPLPAVVADEQKSWLSAAADVVTSVASSVGRAPGQRLPSDQIADPTGGVRPDVDLLSDDDGLGVDLSRASSDGWTEQAAADDPALRMLAEIDAPGAGRELSALPPVKQEEDSWLSAAADLVGGVARTLTGTTPEPATPRAAPGRRPVAVAPSLGGETERGRDAFGSGMIPRASGALPPSRSGAATAAPGDVWSGGTAGASAKVDPMLAELDPPFEARRGGPGSWLSAAAGAVGSVADSIASVVSGADRDRAPGAVARRSAEVDLLAGGDALDGVVLADGNTDGWTQQAAEDDVALAMLAELDRSGSAPSALPPVVSRDDSWLGSASRVVDAFTGRGSGPIARAPSLSATADTRSAQLPATPESAWRDLANRAVSAVSQLVSGPTAPRLARNEPLPDVGRPLGRWSDSDQEQAVDLLADDDGLAVDLAVRSDDAWERTETDEMDQLVAALGSGPLGVTSETLQSGFDRLPEAPAVAMLDIAPTDDDFSVPAIQPLPADRAPVDPAFDDRVLVDPLPITSTVSVAAVAAPAAPIARAPAVPQDQGWAHSAAANLVRSGVALVTGGVTSAVPTATAAIMKRRSDASVVGWRDGESPPGIDADDEYTVRAKETNIAELFYVPGEDEEPSVESVADLDGLTTMVVQIKVNQPGAQIEIDGEFAGMAPTVAEVLPGWHNVVLSTRNGSSSFRIEAVRDPDTWCFEAKGRSFKNVRCL